MPRSKNREYKKGKPHRDFRKFVIVAEGQREDDYFSFFGAINQRVVVEIVPREEGKSAAKYLTERLAKYDEEYGVEPEDFVWFVLDVDRWPRKEIDDLHKHSEQEANWSLAISNPSFEVWLHYHILDVIPVELDSARKLKRNLANLVVGGYNKDDFAMLIGTATINASNADLHKDHYFPEKFVSKLYQLSEKLLTFLGKHWQTKE
ncbi:MULTISPECIES: RloB family protein [Parapedobacter]|uniref:RloB-like protein n=1 Tax=Parapedobacter indicus TaxID=1477437 RepID=A0A1I3DUW6_9SPHI|nr:MULTISPECIES: RloB family protein [Parapedobacter]MEC3879118.1 RloB family protein [Parapedobacter sp. 10938]PPL04850.1 RloB-like protein [Parapedobacter indicus]SFH90433.1 RloB-like protein [Parapedobacter indicus]